MNEKVPLLNTARPLRESPEPRSACQSLPFQSDTSRWSFITKIQALRTHPREFTTYLPSTSPEGGGLGRAAKDAIERMAIEPPLNARVLALDTLAREQALDDNFWKDEDLIAQRPKVSCKCSLRTLVCYAKRSR